MPQQPDTSFDNDLAAVRAEFEADLRGVRQTGASAEAPPARPSGLAEAASEFWKAQPVHPIDIAKGLYRTVTDLPGTVRDVLAAQQKPLDRAAESFQQGDYGAAALDVLNYAVPVIGPQISDLQHRYRAGEIGAGGLLGGGVGLGLQAVTPPKAANAGRLRAIHGITNPNVVERAAVAFGQREGIPIDAATATGNPVVRGAQNLADRSLAGGLSGQRARAAQEAALAQTGQRLATRAHRTAVSPYQAGEAVQDAVEARIGRFSQDANVAYDTLRTIEADPKNTRNVRIKVETTAADGTRKMDTVTVPMQLPVDLRTVKTQLRPVYDRMTRQMPVAQQRADPALHAIKNILDSPDYMPASIIDVDLSAIKQLARTSGPTRNTSQGLAATAVKTLDLEVQRAVAQGGPDAVRALRDGRAATTSKYASADLLKRLRDEPTQVFQQATWANDAGLDRLRAIQREAPAEMAQVGRAYLDDLMNTATAEGGFSRSASIQSKWAKLGPETKKLLFKHDAYIKDLDNFFMLAKKMQENPNPSGSGYTAALTGQGVLLLTEPVSGAALTLAGYGLSRLLHSRAGVQALTRGLTVPVGQKAAAASAFSTLAKTAEAQGVRLLPATAQDDSRR